jgi:iron complex outermembrane receptor protein
VGKLDLFLNYRSQDRRWTAGLFATNVTDVAVKANVVIVSALLGSLAEARAVQR